MNFKLENFFIGVIELFGILLPGAIMVFFLQAHWYDFFFNGVIFSPIPKSYHALVFIVCSYLTGHIIFVIGSILLDDLYDERLKNRYIKNFDFAFLTATQIKNKYLNEVEIKKEMYRVQDMQKVKTLKRLIGFRQKDLITKDVKHALKKSILAAEKNELKEVDVQTVGTELQTFQQAILKGNEIINTFQWTKRVLTLHHPQVMVEINRLEADQKFFRSVAVVFAVIGLTMTCEGIYNWIISYKVFPEIYAIEAPLMSGILCLGIAVLCVFKFGKDRYKNTELAYNFLIAFHFFPPSKDVKAKEN